MKVIGINGFGRIGRRLASYILEDPNMTLALVNDLADVKTLAHLFKYDSIHGQLAYSFKIEENSLVFENGKKISFHASPNPADIPWADYGVELVVDSTGLFLTEEKSKAHLNSSVKKVIMSAPANDGTKTIVLGVNDEILSQDDVIVSNASCTTNCAAPMFKVIKELVEIQSAHVSTIHSFTQDQRLHDAPHKDLRRARAATNSIIPTSTGAAKSLGKIFPDLNGKMSGSSMRVPVADGSITEITFIGNKNLTVEEINQAFLNASESYLKGIMRYTDEPLVSVDIIGDRHSVIFDSDLTTVSGDLIKIAGWYDNEAGYSSRLYDLIKRM